MKHTPTFAALGRAARGILPWGLILALLLGAGTGLLSWRAWEANTPVSARVTLAWSGAESGLDPAGKPFDPDSFRQEEGLTAAIRDAGVDVSADRLAAFLYADPQVPADAVARVTARDSVFEGNDVPSTLALKPEAYYPTTYTLTLDFRALGLTGAEGEALLRSALEHWQAAFLAEQADRLGASAAGAADALRISDVSSVPSFSLRAALSVAGGNILAAEAVLLGCFLLLTALLGCLGLPRGRKGGRKA